MRNHGSTPVAQTRGNSSLFALIENEEDLWRRFVEDHLGQDAELVSISAFSSRRRTFRVGDQFVKVRSKGLETGLRKQTFRGELEILQRLRNVQGVCKGFQRFEDSNWEALWCGYVEGRPLSNLLGRTQEGIRGRTLWRVFVTLLKCNLRGVAHRDLRLDNILVSEGGNVTIVDFDQAARLSPARALMTDILGMKGVDAPPMFSFPSLLSRGHSTARIIRTATRAKRSLRKAASRAKRIAIAFVGSAPRAAARVESNATEAAAQLQSAGRPEDNTSLLQRAWELASESQANAPGCRIAYYSLEVDDQRFEGERPWQQRWQLISRSVNFREKRFLELGCNMGLLSAFARRSGALECRAVDRDATILESARLVARAFEVDVTHSQVDFDSDENWEARLSGYDLVAGLSVVHWLKDKRRFFRFLAKHPEALFEGHDETSEEIRSLESFGFASIRIIGVSDRGRALYHLTMSRDADC